MKNFLINMSIILCLLITIGCSNDDEGFATSATTDYKADLTSHITHQNSNTRFTHIFRDLGVTSIVESENTGKYSLKVGTENKSRKANIRINGFDLELKDHRFVIEKEFLFMENNSDVKITLVENRPFLVSKEFTGFISEDSNLLLDENNLILFLFLNEITILNSKKLPAMVSGGGSGGGGGSCSFWNTYYSYGIGVNQSAALSNFNYNNQNDLNSGELTNCTALGGAEHTSIGVAHYYTKAYCCR